MRSDLVYVLIVRQGPTDRTRCQRQDEDAQRQQVPAALPAIERTEQGPDIRHVEQSEGASE